MRQRCHIVHWRQQGDASRRGHVLAGSCRGTQATVLETRALSSSPLSADVGGTKTGLRAGKGTMADSPAENERMKKGKISEVLF